MYPFTAQRAAHENIDYFQSKLENQKITYVLMGYTLCSEGIHPFWPLTQQPPQSLTLNSSLALELAKNIFNLRFHV